MKKIAILMLGFVASLAAQATNYSGVWNGKGGFEDPKYGSVPSTAQITLLQAGASVSGTLRIGKGPIVKISSGTVSGTQITFAVGPGTGVLTQNGSVLQGKLTSSQGRILDIVFTKQ